jgi:excisionase family DNA binding protein
MSQYLTVPELALVLRRSLWTIYRDAKSGRIPSHRLNRRGRILFDPDEVRAALARNGQAGKDQATAAAV